jgi:hypothetical protein
MMAMRVDITNERSGRIPLPQEKVFFFFPLFLEKSGEKIVALIHFLHFQPQAPLQNPNSSPRFAGLLKQWVLSRFVCGEMQRKCMKATEVLYLLWK